jgi:N-acetylglucosaminyldiphosphoundecaprenol N-acetyl-beta-D-mannosaminyltransferase
MENARRHLIGVRIDLVKLQTLLDCVLASIRNGSQTTIMYVNVHCMNVAAHDPKYREILERADIVYCDGTGVKLAGRVLGVHIPERTTGADWIYDLAAMCERERLSLFFLGSTAESAEGAAGHLQGVYPALRIAGTAPGYGVNSNTVALINDAAPDVLLVGMGTPTQERWIDAHAHELNVSVVWAVGALFDFVSGRIPRGPHWMTEHGLEWLCRLVVEPRKLWKRYFLGNPRFMVRVLRAALVERRAQTE